MKRKRITAYILLYNFIGLTVAAGGWLWEVMLFLIKEQRFVNRGFLYGPYLPVYGTGAVLLSILFYHKDLAVMITYARFPAARFPKIFYHSPFYKKLQMLIQCTIKQRFPAPIKTGKNPADTDSVQKQLLSPVKPKRIYIPADSCQKNCTPDVRISRTPGISTSRMPGIKTSRMPGISMSSTPGISTFRSPGISMSRFLENLRIFFISMTGGSLTELITGWFLWHVFARRYWDYRGYPLNLAGYICIYSALGFGLFGLVWMNWISPHLIRLWEKTSFSIQILIIGLCDMALITDAVFSLMQPNSGDNITFTFLLSCTSCLSSAF